MAIYAVGDIQGCSNELRALMEKLHFDPTTDQLWLVGDLVNRGPDSLAALRLIRELGTAAITVLGNHDLHLLALGHARQMGADAPVADTWLQPVLDAPDSEELLDWLQQQPLAHFDTDMNTLLVHAGVEPGWTIKNVMDYAAEVSTALRGESARDFLLGMYGSKPDRWSEQLTGQERLRFITNCLTRIRYCTDEHILDFEEKLEPGTQPEHLRPWFELPERATGDARIVFGHWSTLGLMQKPGLLALDTGCVWGGKLTAMRLDEDADPVEVSSGQTPRFD